MNAQLTTIDQARWLAAELNKRGIGGGVLPEVNSGTAEAPDYHNDQSGIYLDLWNPAFNPEPQLGDAWGYLLRFKNGAGGNNVGLILDRLKRYPTAPEYVYRELGKEVDAMAANALEG